MKGEDIGVADADERRELLAQRGDLLDGALGLLDSPAQRLWDLLVRNDKDAARWDIGSTPASKIMARKRPQLIPIGA